MLNNQNMESSNWQTQFSTLRERSEYAFDKSLFCDVEFSVVLDSDGNKVTILSNKYVLAVTSPVFAAMFYGHLAETKPTIDLPECTKEGLQEMLRYAHYEEANLTGNNVMEVLYLAKKYMMPFLEEKCKKYLKTEVGPEDVFTVLPQVQKMGDKDLEDHFWEIVDNETQRAISSESLLDVSKDLLCQVLKRDTLSAPELNLFQAINKWANKRIDERELVCDGETKRAILGDEVIRLIRFPSVPEKEFVEIVLPIKVLNIDEITELLQIFNGITPVTSMFLQNRRRFSPNVLISRFSIISPNAWNYSGLPDAINFSVNKDVNLVGVRLFGSENSKYDVQFEIMSVQSCFVVTEVSLKTSLKSENIDGLYYGFTVTFDEPVRLVDGRVYRLEATISGPPSWRGTDGQEIVCAEDIVVTFRNSKKPNNCTDVNVGQFLSLILQHIYK